MKKNITKIKASYYCRRSYKGASYKVPETTAFIAACYMEMNFHCVISRHPLAEIRAAVDISKDRPANIFNSLIFRDKRHLFFLVLYENKLPLLKLR